MENKEETKTEETTTVQTPEIQEVNAENLLSTDSNSESENSNSEPKEENKQEESFVVSQESIDYITKGLIWIFGSGAIIAYNMYFEDKIIEKDLYTADDKKFLRPHYDVISEKLCQLFGIGKKGDNLMAAVMFIALGTAKSLHLAEKQSSKAAKEEPKPKESTKQKEEKEKPSFDQGNENNNVFEVREIRKNGLVVEENKPKKGRPRKNS